MDSIFSYLAGIFSEFLDEKYFHLELFESGLTFHMLLSERFALFGIAYHILSEIKNKSYTWKYVLSQLAHPPSKFTDNTVMYNVLENLSSSPKQSSLFYSS